MNNIYYSKEFQDQLRSLKEIYDNRILTKEYEKKVENLPKMYKIIIKEYTATEGRHWKLCKIEIYKNEDLEMEIFTDYSSVKLLYGKYKNEDYLFTNECYQGFTIINLTNRTKYNYVPSLAKIGAGWCTTYFYDFDEEDAILICEGCVWGGDITKRYYTLNHLGTENIEEYDKDFSNYEEVFDDC